jgi:hypothetical protein
MNERFIHSVTQYQDKQYTQYIQQPQAMPVMSISAGGNRNAKNMPMDADGRDWSNGLCDCCNEPGTCMFNSAYNSIEVVLIWPSSVVF